MNRFVITGATGHIGNNLVRMLEEKYPDIKIKLLLRKENSEELDGTRAEKKVGDLSDVDFLEDNIVDGDVVVHLAGVIDIKNRKKAECHKINYLLTKNITDIAMRKNIRKFIYVGSVDAVYKDENPVREPLKYYPEKMLGNYAVTKAMASDYLMCKIAENPSFPAVILLPSAVVGINDFKPSAVGKIIKSAIMGGMQFGIDGGYDFVDVADVCRAIITLSEKSYRGQFLITGESVSVRDIYRMINKITKTERKQISLPKGLLNIVLDKKTMASLFENPEYDCEKARSVFGYSPTPIEKTFEDTVKWFMERIENEKKNR